MRNLLTCANISMIIESMKYIHRTLEPILQHTLKRGKSILLLGPRQTGKTTLIKRLNADKHFSFVDSSTRLRYEKHPELFQGEIEALRESSPKKNILVVIDEIQKIPRLMDTIQYLIDNNKAQFVITGSSARKLRKSSNTNLLPGRVVALKLDPLSYQEKAEIKLEDHLLFGSLPGIIKTTKKHDKETDLASYVTTYLDEEVRSEAIVRNIGSFAQFLELAAIHSGKLINFRKLSQEIGVAHTTIASYYEVLEDCFIIERIEPIIKSSKRKRLTRSCKYLFFDLGVRRACAQEEPILAKQIVGELFEQFIGLEISRHLRSQQISGQLKFWRDPSGPEIDWVIAFSNKMIPLEVKWTTTPHTQDAKHLEIFLKEYPEAKKGYIICQSPSPIKISPKVTAIPWQDMYKVLN